MSIANLFVSNDYNLFCSDITVGSSSVPLTRAEFGSYVPTISSVGGSNFDITGAVVNYARYMILGDVCHVDVELELPNGTIGAVAVAGSLGVRITPPFTAVAAGLMGIGGPCVARSQSVSPTNPVFGIGNTVLIGGNLIDLNMTSVIASAGASGNDYLVSASFSYQLA